MWFYHCFLERHYEIISLLYTIFGQKKTYPEETCAFIPITPIKTGWTFLAIIPRHGERKTLESTVDEVGKHFGSLARISYASWKEQLSFWWALVHQYLSSWVYSSYITPWTVHLVAGEWTIYVWEYDALSTHSLVSTGITFDLIKRKILLNGQKINHKVLCSQSATIEIFLYLFDHLNEFIPNRVLPASAYSRNKNEMISKIILPLQTLLQKNYADQLEVVCTGTMFDRTICLKKKSPHIHVLTYMQEPTEW